MSGTSRTDQEWYSPGSKAGIRDTGSLDFKLIIETDPMIFGKRCSETVGIERITVITRRICSNSSPQSEKSWWDPIMRSRIMKQDIGDAVTTPLGQTRVKHRIIPGSAACRSYPHTRIKTESGWEPDALRFTEVVRSSISGLAQQSFHILLQLVPARNVPEAGLPRWVGCRPG